MIIDNSSLRADDIVHKFPGTEADVQAVADWLGCAVEDLSLTVADEPAAIFAERAQNLLATYPQFPKEAARTKRIVSALKRGDPQYPVFVDASDGFLMEGRHRIVAFHLLGLPTVPTVYVRRFSLEHEPTSTVRL